MLLPVWEDIAAIQVRLPAFLQTDRYTDGEKEGGEEGETARAEALHPCRLSIQL